MRINPNEIHLSNPENYDKIYAQGSKFYKHAAFYRAFSSSPWTSFATPSNEVHRVRRAALNPFFSRKRVLELEDVVQSKVAKLREWMVKAFATGKHIDLYNGFRAISVDVITDYAFGKCYDFLEDEDFGASYFTMFRELVSSFWVFQQFPFLQSIAIGMPMWLARLTNKSAAGVMQIQEVLYTSLASAIRT